MKGPKPKTLEERFWPKVDKNGPIVSGMESCCWVWTGAKYKNGYGAIGRGGHAGALVGAHRVSWEISMGSIPDGLFVMHKCDNRACVRPDHLSLGTHADNMRDMTRKSRTSATIFTSERTRGVNNLHSKLTERQVIDIRVLYGCGIIVADLARLYGLTHQSTRAICVRETWSHVK